MTVETKNSISAILKTLNEREANLLEMLFGLNGEEELTMSEIAKKWGISRTRVSQIRNIALRKMRHPARAKYLKAR